MKGLKRGMGAIICVVFCLTLSACATVPADRYNTQKGSAIGAGLGALIGQAIGRNTEGTLLGMASGAVLGALVGNAQDQSFSAARSAAGTGKRVVYYDDHGGAVEAAPMGVNQSTKCHKVRKRTWENGQVISDTVEEICEGNKTSTDY